MSTLWRAPLSGLDQVSDAALLERARSLISDGCYTVALQRRRLKSTEPEDRARNWLHGG
jgi:hypothetical protein